MHNLSSAIFYQFSNDKMRAYKYDTTSNIFLSQKCSVQYRQPALDIWKKITYFPRFVRRRRKQNLSRMAQDIVIILSLKYLCHPGHDRYWIWGGFDKPILGPPYQNSTFRAFRESLEELLDILLKLCRAFETSVFYEWTI